MSQPASPVEEAARPHQEGERARTTREDLAAISSRVDEWDDEPARQDARRLLACITEVWNTTVIASARTGDNAEAKARTDTYARVRDIIRSHFGGLDTSRRAGRVTADRESAEATRCDCMEEENEAGEPVVLTHSLTCPEHPEHDDTEVSR